MIQNSKTTGFVFAFITVLVHVSASFGQSPPPPIARATPAETSELSEAEFKAKLLNTLQKPQNWKQNSFPGFGVKVDLPREPVRQTETFYEEELGNSKMVTYVAAGESGIFVVGSVAIPYSITEEKLLRETYNEVVKEFANDPDLKFGEPKDFYIGGKLGLEMSSVKGNLPVPAKARVFLSGRNVILMFAVPREVEDGEVLSKALTDGINKDLTRFFSSAVLEMEVDSAAAAKPDPQLDGSFADGIYRSSYFKFYLQIPKGWIRVTADDVEGVRQWGRDFLSANSSNRLPVNAKNRQNFATFVSEPLGNEGVASISINRGVPATKADDDLKMALLAESLLTRVPAYTSVKKPTRVKIGLVPAVVFESKINISDKIQNQIVYFFQRNGFVLAITIGYHNASDRATAVASAESLAFQ